MTPRRQRTWFVVIVLLGVSSATALALMAIGDFKQLYKDPSQIAQALAEGDAIAGKIKVGGLVVDGSVQREPGNLQVEFDVTDTKHSVRVLYKGILPDLFREGQGIIATGELRSDGVLLADEVLAKHDETYMPPPVKASLERAGVDLSKARHPATARPVGAFEPNPARAGFGRSDATSAQRDTQ